MTVEYSYNRIFLGPHFYAPSNETRARWHRL